MHNVKEPLGRLSAGAATAGKIAKELYLELDLRILALFRILFGIVLLCDTLWRFGYVDVFYSNQGLLANHTLLFWPVWPMSVSLFSSFSTSGEASALFLFMAAVDVAYIFGFRTRFAQILALLLHVSLNARMPMLEFGGSVSELIALSWTLFLPLGRMASLDAYFHGESKQTSSTFKLHSIAALGIALQICAIYFFNTVHKTGSTWTNGEAVHYLLWQDRIATAFAGWVRLHEPFWLSPFLTYGTLVIEGIIPLLVLSPFWQRQTRTLSFLLATSLHIGIALFTNLGPFSYVLVCLNLLLLPGWALDRTWRWLGPHARRILARPTWFLAAILRPFAVAAERPVTWSSPVTARRMSMAKLYAREAAVAIFALAIFFQVARDNEEFPRWVGESMPLPLEKVIEYPRLLQGWRMFAPDAPRDDGELLIDAVTTSGLHIDPLRGRLPDEKLLFKEPDGRGTLWCNYEVQFVGPRFAAHRIDLRRYLFDRYTYQGERIEQYSVFWLSTSSPAPGSTTRGAIVRGLVIHERR